MSLVGLRVDIIINLDVALARKFGVPVAGGMVLLTSLVLSVIKRVSITIAVLSVGTIGSHGPVKFVVRNVLVSGDVRRFVRVGSSDGDKSQNNDSNLYRLNEISILRRIPIGLLNFFTFYSSTYIYKYFTFILVRVFSYVEC